jgi:hypothetical protein
MIGKLRKLLIGGKDNVHESSRAAHASWEVIQGRKCLVITFNGIFTEADANKLTDYLNRQIAELAETDTFPLICRCLYMTDYEAHARLVFQNFLQAHVNRLESIWIVTESNVIKYGSKLMNIFVSIPIQVVANESQIKLA